MRCQPKVDARADRYEEEAKQQPLEGVNVAFELVPVFAVGENNAGKKCSQCGGEADDRHQQRNADYEDQRRSSEQLAQIGPRDITEQRASEVIADQDHGTDRRDAHHCREPDRKVGGQVEPAMACPFCDMPDTATDEIGHGKQRQEREDRDHRNVLQQKH